MIWPFPLGSPFHWKESRMKPIPNVFSTTSTMEWPQPPLKNGLSRLPSSPNSNVVSGKPVRSNPQNPKPALDQSFSPITNSSNTLLLRHLRRSDECREVRAFYWNDIITDITEGGYCYHGQFTLMGDWSNQKKRVFCIFRRTVRIWIRWNCHFQNWNLFCERKKFVTFLLCNSSCWNPDTGSKKRNATTTSNTMDTV